MDQWFSFAAIADDNTRAGSKQAFGTAHRAHYHFDKAKVIVTLDADPLMAVGPGIANSIAFAKGRDADNKSMSRMYAVESQFSTTGASADHRISVPSSKIAGFAAALGGAIDSSGEAVDKSLPYRERVLAAMASDLVAHKAKASSLLVNDSRRKFTPWFTVSTKNWATTEKPSRSRNCLIPIARQQLLRSKTSRHSLRVARSSP